MNYLSQNDGQLIQNIAIKFPAIARLFINFARTDRFVLSLFSY